MIARYTFADLPEAPSHASLWTLAWNWSDMPLSAFRSLLAEYAELMQVLPEPCFTLLKLNHQAAGQLALVLQLASHAGLTRSEHGLHLERQVDSLKARFATSGARRAAAHAARGPPGATTSASPICSRNGRTSPGLTACMPMSIAPAAAPRIRRRIPAARWMAALSTLPTAAWAPTPMACFSLAFAA